MNDSNSGKRGYEYTDNEGRNRRSPFSDRAIDDVNRYNDPSARGQRPQSPRRISRPRDGPRPPIVTIEQPREDQRRYVPPGEREIELPHFARLSESPPQEASRDRVRGYSQVFADIEPPARSHPEERLQSDPAGPGDPYAPRRELGRSQSPEIVSDRAPSPNPFAPGGRSYDRQLKQRRRQAQDLDPSGDGERDRDDRDGKRTHFHSQIGEPWGVASWAESEARRALGRDGTEGGNE